MWQKIGHVLWWLGIATYFGGMVVLPVAAASVFGTVRRVGATLPGVREGLNATDQLGGELFGDVLRRFGTIEWISLTLMVAGFVFLQLAGTFGRRARIAVAGGILLLAVLTTYSNHILHPQVLQTRASIREKPSQESEQAFARQHKASTRIGQVKLLVLLGLLTGSAWALAPRAGRQAERQNQEAVHA